MSQPCTIDTNSPATLLVETSATVDAPEILREVIQRYGTPTFAYDVGRIRTQVAKLRTHLPPEVEILYSLKANASLGLCGVLAECGLGADVASAGELATALAAGFSPRRIFLTGPDRSPRCCASAKSSRGRRLGGLGQRVASHGVQGPAHRVLLRLRPDFSSYATCSAGPDLRFGLTLEDLPSCRELLPSPPTLFPEGEGSKKESR